MTAATHTPMDRAKAFKASGMRCNCDLDNWEPERSTGHSHVCRIHRAAIAKAYDMPMPSSPETGDGR